MILIKKLCDYPCPASNWQQTTSQLSSKNRYFTVIQQIFFEEVKNDLFIGLSYSDTHFCKMDGYCVSVSLVSLNSE